VSERTVASRLGIYGGQAFFARQTHATSIHGLVRHARRQALGALGLAHGAGCLAPRTHLRSPVLLPVVRPVWLVSARGAPEGTADTARRAGFAPGLLCHSLADIDHQGAQAPVPFCIVPDGPSPGAVGRAVADGLLEPHGSVFLHVDLRGTDWRTAACALRRAFWLAAWQGLAGVAVTGPPPAEDVQRQRAVWHVLRDARRDVSLWQAASRTAGSLLETEAEDDRTRLTALRLEDVVGAHAGAALKIRRQPRAFREVYVLPPPDTPAEAPQAMDRALEVATAAWTELAPKRDKTRGHQLYWDGRPMTDRGLVRWSIVAAGGEKEWKAGLRMQEHIADRSGEELLLTRALPLVPDTLDVIWVLADAEEPGSLPVPVRKALEDAPQGELVTARLEDGPVLAILRDVAMLDALLAGIHATPRPFAPARSVK
jgi:hypothetical protein